MLYVNVASYYKLVNKLNLCKHNKHIKYYIRHSNVVPRRLGFPRNRFVGVLCCMLAYFGFVVCYVCFIICLFTGFSLFVCWLLSLLWLLLSLLLSLLSVSVCFWPGAWGSPEIIFRHVVCSYSLHNIIHIYIYIYMYTHLSLSLYVCIYIYIYIHVCTPNSAGRGARS